MGENALEKEEYKRDFHPSAFFFFIVNFWYKSSWVEPNRSYIKGKTLSDTYFYYFIKFEPD